MRFLDTLKEYAEKTGDKPALLDRNGKRTMTYRELDVLSGRVAAKLQAKKIPAGSPVMICMGRSSEYIGAYIGIIKAGCAVVPIVPDYPDSRVKFILSDCGCACLIEESFFDDIEDYEPAGAIEMPEDASSILLYTSGSTGNPKGIRHTRRSFDNSAFRSLKDYDLKAPVQYAASAPLSFIAVFLEYFKVFAVGGCSHILSEEVRRDIRLIAKYYTEHKINIGFMSPQILRFFDCDSPYIERLMTGSERLSGVYSDRYEILNVYGLSETAVTVTTFPVDRPYDNTPIGKPVEGVELFLLDDEGKEVPQGTEGEICLKGYFAVEYLNLPEQTARTFIDCGDGLILLHTGDLGKLDENGNLVYVNRKDWMVKINGQRVETSEIEALLNGISGVTAAVVKAFEDDMGQTYIVAYYTADRQISQSELVSALQIKLPEYMIPRYFRQLAQMPKNTNGKLDRKALKPPTSDDYHADYVAPKNDVQKKLCKTMEQVLQCERVGIHDDFFRLGGDSIKVLALIVRAELEGLTPAMILEGKNAEEIARIYAEKSEGTVIAHQNQVMDSYPLTEAQLGVYLECIEDPQSMMYNIPMYGRLPKNTDRETFIKAVKKVISAHPVLNVRVGTTDAGVPSMFPTDRTVNVECREAERISDALKELIRPFDIENEPLYRVELVKCGDDEYFFFDIHHLVFDGTSVQVWMQQIAKAYSGQDIEAEPLSIFDVALYERTLKDTPAYQKAQEYFEEKLNGMDTDSRPVSDIIETAPEKGGARVVYSLNETAELSRTEQFVRENGFTENTLFMGAFAYTLAKFNAAKDAYFCTVNNGRHDPRLQDSIGMFVKTLPIYIQCSDEERVSDYLKKTQTYFYDTMKHDCISFGELAEKYGVGTDIAFVYQADILNGTDIAGSNMILNDCGSGDVQFDLNIMVMKTAGGYHLTLNYRKELYSEALMQSFAQMYANVVKGMLTMDTLGDIAFTDSYSAGMIRSFNMTEAPYDTTTTVISIFRENAKRLPDHPVVVFKDITMTYSEMDRLTDILAKNLRRDGIGREKVVGVLIPRSEYMMICSLGILKAGGAYLPLDPSYPPERLNLMVKDSGAEILITTPELDHIINEEFTGKRIMISEIPLMQDNDITLPEPKPDDLFIMLYTSGSTGLPKGVMLEHGNLNTFCAWYRKACDMDENSRATAYASYGFDACMCDIYPTLTAGGTLYIISDDMRLNLNELHQYMGENRITHAVMTTQIGRQFALMGQPGSMKSLIMGGEKLVPFAPPDYNVGNAYGPTECTICVTVYWCREQERDIPIGKALENVKLYVIDAKGRLLPFGAAGELLIAGPQVARGYLNRPEQTAAAFTKNTFTDEPEYQRSYHTGDIVRYMSDGNLQFIGRRDAQVKVRGFRIELTEVEEVIRRFGNIKDATVAAYDDPAGGKYIAAYIVSDEKIDIEALNNFILSEKPPYMVPAVTMQIDAIPYNQNQKVNKRALPVPERRIENAVPPQNDTQQRIYDCVAEIVGHKEFGVNTNIYLAGLTSIGAVKLNVLLSDAFGVPVKTSDLKENDTVEKLEAFFNAAEKAEAFEVQSDYGITKTQEGIFVESIAKPNSTVYNIPILLEIGQKLDTDRLKTALVAAVNAHPYIKTRMFLNDDGDLRQRRMDGDDSFDENAIEVIKADSLDSIRDQLVKPFKLIGGRLFRIKLIEADKTYLFVEMHHIICDGSSMLIFLDDVTKAYCGEKLQTETYSAYEVVQNEEKLRQSSYFEKAKQYFTDLMADAETETLPLGDKRETGEDMSAVVVKPNQALTESDVRRFCEENKLSMNAFFTAVFGFVLSKYSHSDHPAFASIYNGRSDSRLSRTVSMLVKTLPVVCNVENADKTVREYVADMGTQLMDSMANDIYSFAEISRELSAKSDVMFAYQGSEFGFDSLCGEPAVLHNLSLDQAKAPLNINVFLKDRQIQWYAEYNADRYSEEYIENFLSAMDTAAGEFIRNKRLKEVSVLSEKAAARIAAFNATDFDQEYITCNKLFERSVLANPDKTAVICADEKYTYRELNNDANKVANILIESGIITEERVAVILPRTIRAYAAREGVLKAGGAYLPIDPEYPDERVTYILSDSDTKRIVTDEKTAADRKALFEDYKVFTIEELLTGDCTENPHPSVKPENLAYCIYTSGSTGKPKGVMIEHHNLANFAMNNRNNPNGCGYCAFADKERTVLALAALTFDVSVLEESVPLYNGATVAMATDEEIHNPVQLAEMILKNGVDVMKCTPSYMNNMLDMPETHKVLAQIRFMVIGAEAFPSTLYQKLRQSGITAHISNSYGPTETTVTTAIAHITNDYITIGHPLANCKIFMLDKYGNLMPPFVPGELTICGSCVGRGYVGNEKLTAEKFFTYQGLPAYRSGDLARFDNEGRIVFMGRMDNQVKLRGLRVELDEIEKVMNSYPNMKQSVVLLKGDETQGQFLCGYFTASEKVDLNSLTEHLKKYLTHYMVPSVLMQLEKMPMTNNGKIDKRSLPEPVSEKRKGAGAEPANERERQFCDMFAKILGLSKVYADDDFFEIGGTSLSASKIAVKAMTMGLPVVYKDVFEYPTAQKLAAFISEKNGEEQKSSQPSVPEMQKNDKEPLYDVLCHNVPSEVSKIVYNDYGNVLLTGATGFLGVHVLRKLIDSNVPKIYCLVRRSDKDNPENRLKVMLMYYFDNTFAELFGSRIFVVDGDITDNNLYDTVKGIDFDTVINCAACVKHFTNSDILDRVNLYGVENLIDICLKADKKLIQVSTVSVAGMSVNESIPEYVVLKENMLEFGQNVDNRYAYTKMMAEKALLTAVKEKGLRGKICRVGNLMSREEDGEFQANFNTNGFMNRLRAYAVIGCFPVSMLDQKVEFSAIDYTAEAIIRLAGTPDQFTVFHANSCHTVHMANVLAAMAKRNIKIDIVSDEEFRQEFEKALKDDERSMDVSALISYQSHNVSQRLIGRDNTFTVKALYRLNFSWPLVSEDYIERAIDSMITLDFFD